MPFIDRNFSGADTDLFNKKELKEIEEFTTTLNYKLQKNKLGYIVEKKQPDPGITLGVEYKTSKKHNFEIYLSKYTNWFKSKYTFFLYTETNNKLPLLFEDNRFLDDFFPLHLNIYNFIKMYITLELPLSNESIKKLKDVTGFGR
jgi:hypothetical protein